MTAINIVARPDQGAIYVLTDAAIYTKADGVSAFGLKAYPVANWPGLVTGVGNANASLILAFALAQTFGGEDVAFDTMIATSDMSMPEYLAGTKFPGGGEIIICGISKARNRPEIYSFRLDDTIPPGVTPAEIKEAIKQGFYAEKPGQLLKLPDNVMTPVPPLQLSLAANYEGIKPTDTEDQVIWSMRKHLTMQRHMPLADDVSGIGGFATLTKITADGITQRIVDRWPEDQIGGLIRPARIDWQKWHADNPRP
ncbi:MAG: hypothetical protein J0H71_18015 [Rhizobiales bacterium]|nr:hypothetical protein [Hyphomicrobiales bacterium]